MPTCTLPFEVLFEFVNDTSSAATIQLTRADGDLSSGAVILLQRGESVSLVLNAGSIYHYKLRQMDTQARISVKAWHDTQCSAAKVIAGQYGQDYEAWTPSQGIAVTCLGRDA